MKTFTRIKLPDGRMKRIPDDVVLRFPIRTSDPAEAIKLVEIAWDEAYWQKIPGEFQIYWTTAFPFLHARTTDVHTAICLGIMDDFLKKFSGSVYDRLVIGVGIIFHDTGWSQLPDTQIAASLGVSGLALTATATEAKEAHLREGLAIAKRELARFTILAPEQRHEILAIVADHDFPERVGEPSLSFQIACDLDHLWSFTHENFWQDTIRKDIEPLEYWQNLEKDLDAYFQTEQGGKMARAMLGLRRDELVLYSKTR